MSERAPAAQGGRPLDASMSLLVRASENPLDPAYLEVASRRGHPHAASERGVWRTVVTALVAAALGLGTVWAVRELRAPAPDALQARVLLEEEIQRRTSEAEDLAGRNAELSAEVDALAAEALGDGGALLREVTASGVPAGTVAVQGPGLTVTLTDSPRASAGDPDAADERVQDVDLQIVSNGLWAAGAEAIAINGRRLTALSAIRSAGEAILVDLTPLVGPYVIQAIGDPEAMQVALARTAAARHLTLLRDTYQIGAAVAVTERMDLAAIPIPALRFAEPVAGFDGTTGIVDVSGLGRKPGETT